MDPVNINCQGYPSNVLIFSLKQLCANSVFGKSVESVRNRTRFVIIRDRETALRYIKKPTVAGVTMLETDDDSEIAILRMRKLSVTLDKPLYIGVTVLDDAKRILYEWYYDYALPKWGDNFVSIATDTDSIYCWIRTNDVYEDIFKDKDGFDMSVFPKKCPVFGRFHDDTNCKKPGKMKDENAGKVMSQMIFLRAKSYTFTVEDPQNTATAGVEKDVKKNKGIPKKVLNQQCSTEDYLEALQTPIQKSLEIVAIEKRLHEIYTMILWKKGLSGFDPKRYHIDEINSLPYGHYLITHPDNWMITQPPPVYNALWIDRWARHDML